MFSIIDEATRELAPWFVLPPIGSHAITERVIEDVRFFRDEMARSAPPPRTVSWWDGGRVRWELGASGLVTYATGTEATSNWSGGVRVGVGLRFHRPPDSWRQGSIVSGLLEGTKDAVLGKELTVDLRVHMLGSFDASQAWAVGVAIGTVLPLPANGSGAVAGRLSSVLSLFIPEIAVGSWREQYGLGPDRESRRRDAVDRGQVELRACRHRWVRALRLSLSPTSSSLIFDDETRDHRSRAKRRPELEEVRYHSRMVAPKTKLATFADLAALAEHVRAEVIHGVIVEKASPSAEHGGSQLKFGAVLDRRFQRRPGGRWPGGWWLGTEIEVEYETHEIYLHDLVGWRRDRVPHRPVGRPVRTRPDWVCEMLSPSNAKRDLVDKFKVLQANSVPHYWIADPIEQTLIVHRWEARGYLVVLTAAAGDLVRAEPFDTVELRVSTLFGVDEDEE
jgi:Uma2 family endonuclease